MASGGLRRLFSKKENSKEDELKQLLDNENEENSGLSRREVIKNLFEFDDIDAGDIMTHRTDIVAVDDEATIMDVADAAIKEGVSRIPVFHEDLDDILGIIYAKDLLRFVGREISADENIKDYVREPLYVPETIACGRLFEEMTETRIQLAVVVDEYGGTAGLVTLEDILEELVGDIADEYDEEDRSIVKISENTYIFEGVTDIEDVEETLGITFPEGDYDTLAGFVISRLGYLPDDGDRASVEYENIRFTVLSVEDRRIDKIKAERLNKTSKDGD